MTTPRSGRRRFLAAALGLACAWALAAASAGAESPADAALRERLETRLAALADPDDVDLRVAVREGQVILQGRVRLLEQSLQAERLAWKTDGVIDVDNEIRVVPANLGGDAAIERRVRLLIKDDGRFLDTNLELEVSAGLVRLRGLFQDPTDVLALKHRIASIPGVLDVKIDALLVARATGRPDRG